MKSLNCDEHKWQSKLIELIKMEKRKLWFRMLKFCLYMHDYDPYAIFKRRDAKSQEQIICLSMRHTEEDDFRRRITLPVRIFAAYNLIKSLIIAFAMHTRMRYEHLVPKYHHSRPLMSLETCQSIASHLGMPYYELKDISLGFISTTACFFFVCTIVLPLYHRRRPMDIAQLRFLLEPRHELARVDASVRRRLAAIRVSLGVYRNSKLAIYKQRHLSLFTEHSYSQATRQNWQAEDDSPAHCELQYCHRIKKILEQFVHAHKSDFRPSTFSPRAYTVLAARANCLVLGAFVSYAICGSFISVCLFYAAYSSKCPGRFDCNPLHVFTWPELLIILETLAYITIACASSMLNTALFGMLTLCQLDLISEVKHELAACHRAMVEFAAHIDGHEGDEQQRARQRDKLEYLMLKSITRLSIYDRELKGNARCISQQTVHPACYLASAIVLAAINVQFKLPASGLLRWFVVSLLWVTVNSVALSCANIHARVLGFQRQLWSVLAVSSRLLAEEIHTQTSDGGGANQRQLVAPSRRHRFEWRSSPQSVSGTRSYGVRPGSFVADLWRKFVLSTSSNVEQHCSRLLNFQLSYQTIIEANFFSIFIYSLTLGHDK